MGTGWTPVTNTLQRVGIIAMAWMVNGIFDSDQTVNVDPVCRGLPVYTFNSAFPRFIKIQSLNGQNL